MEKINEILPIFSLLLPLVIGSITGYAGYRVSQALYKKEMEEMKGAIKIINERVDEIEASFDTRMSNLQTDLHRIDIKVSEMSGDVKAGFADVKAELKGYFRSINRSE
jgi:hypothetical protein